MFEFFLFEIAPNFVQVHKSKPMKDKFLRITQGNVQLVTYNGNVVRTYWTLGNCSRADWYKVEEESVLLQLSNGKLVQVNKNGGVIRTI
jgi:hypothetical protein